MNFFDIKSHKWIDYYKNIVMILSVLIAIAGIICGIVEVVDGIVCLFDSIIFCFVFWVFIAGIFDLFFVISNMVLLNFFENVYDIRKKLYSE